MEEVASIEGICDVGAIIVDGDRSWNVKCLQPIDRPHQNHTWTTHRPESTWTTDGETIRLEE